MFWVGCICEREIVNFRVNFYLRYVLSNLVDLVYEYYCY